MQSKIFSFYLSQEDSVEYLESQKKDQNKFVNAVSLGEKVKKLCNEDDLDNLKQTIDQNISMIPQIQVFLEEAFEQSVLYRYEDIINYFLQNGYKLQNSKHLNPLVQTSRFLKNDPPFEVLEILLKNGADPEEIENENYRTPLHLSCKYGIQQFIRLLIENNAQVNSVDKKKRTPLFYLNKAILKDKTLNNVHQMMIEKGAKLTYKEELPQY